MAAPGGKTGGRVSIRVIPDATKFRSDLKLLLKRVEQSMSANLMVDADTSKAQATLRKFQKDWNKQEVTLGTGVESGAATAMLRYVSRPRMVALIVQVSKSSVAKASTIIASLAGARLAGDLVENLSKRLQNIDRALPKITAVALSVGSIGAAALSSVGGVFTLGAGLASILGLAVALPGVLSGLAVGVGTMALALSDTGDQLGFLKPKFIELKKVVSDNFWAVAKRPIVSFINDTLPGLRDGLGRTATAIGEWSSSVVDSFRRALGGGVIDQLFTHLVQSIQVATTGTDAFVQSLVTLGGVGGAYLPRLAQWVSDLSVRFNEFITAAAADGRLQATIDTAIVATQNLGSALASLASIWAGIASAAEAAGGGGLASFAAGLATIAAIVNGPMFQEALTTVFQGAASGAGFLADALIPIGNMLATLAPVIAQILSSSGQVVGHLLGDIAAALSQPAFSEGLTAFFAGIQDGLKGIGPALPALAQAFGTLMTFAGGLAAQLGPVLGVLLQALAPALTAILDAITPLLPVLGAGFTEIIKSLAPVLLELITTLLPPIAELIGALLPVLMPIVEAVLPIISALLPPLMAIISSLLPILTPLLGVLTPIIKLLGMILTPILEILSPLFEILGGVIGIVAELLGGMLKTNLAYITGFLTGDFGGAIKQVEKIWSDMWNNVGGIFETIWNGIVGFGKAAFNSLAGFAGSAINGIIDVINGFLGGLRDMAAGIKELTGGAIDIRVPKLPHIKVPRLAVGADVLPSLGGTLVTLGEGGQRETVVNYGGMNKLLQLTARLAKRSLTMGAGGQITIPVYGAPNEDPRLIARAVGQEFEDLMAGA